MEGVKELGRKLWVRGLSMRAIAHGRERLSEEAEKRPLGCLNLHRVLDATALIDRFNISNTTAGKWLHQMWREEVVERKGRRFVAAAA